MSLFDQYKPRDMFLELVLLIIGRVGTPRLSKDFIYPKLYTGSSVLVPVRICCCKCPNLEEL